MKISLEELQQGHAAFISNEPRDAMYRVASFLVKEWWGMPEKLADALTVLLLTWNAAYYQKGAQFDASKLQTAIRLHLPILEEFRNRTISSYDPAENLVILRLFNDFEEALRISNRTVRSRAAVSAAKALHLLAPSFFPLWDKRIASAWDCDYSGDPGGTYIRFLRLQSEALKAISGPFEHEFGPLKLLDEYNYCRFTKGWT